MKVLFSFLVFVSLLGDETALPGMIENTAQPVQRAVEGIRRSQTYDYDSFDVYLDNLHYLVTPEGRITVRAKGGKWIDSFRLNTSLIVEDCYFYHHKNDLIVFYTDTDSEYSGSFTECYDLKTYTRKWYLPCGGFNLANPWIAGKKSYVATIGFAARINMETGRYDWKNDSLYEMTTFDAFDSLSFSGDTVFFYGIKHPLKLRQPRCVGFHHATGRILRIVR
jgi:hypothetical protein